MNHKVEINQNLYLFKTILQVNAFNPLIQYCRLLLDCRDIWIYPDERTTACALMPTNYFVVVILPSRQTPSPHPLRVLATHHGAGEVRGALLVPGPGRRPRRAPRRAPRPVAVGAHAEGVHQAVVVDEAVAGLQRPLLGLQADLHDVQRRH